jgi:hypothetical protein
MMVFLICTLLLAALCVAWIVSAFNQQPKLRPEPIPLRHERRRRR